MFFENALSMDKFVIWLRRFLFNTESIQSMYMNYFVSFSLKWNITEKKQKSSEYPYHQVAQWLQQNFTSVVQKKNKARQVAGESHSLDIAKARVLLASIRVQKKVVSDTYIFIDLFPEGCTLYHPVLIVLPAILLQYWDMQSKCSRCVSNRL